MAKKYRAVAVDASVAQTIELVASRAKKMSPAEFRKSLVGAGIISPNGKLTAKYAHVKKK